MQCKFREDQNHTATLLSLNVNHEITVKKEHYALQKSKADLDAWKITQAQKNESDILA